MKHSTIAAIATPQGVGAIAVIRISGGDAFKIADKIFSKRISEKPSHTAHYGKILDNNNEVIDHVLLLLMKGPKSYTGEDTVEIYCHGGTILPKRVLERAIAGGASLAKAGEFSLRAFMHGKIDLAQAEAVQELIAANSEFASKVAKEHLEGSLSSAIREFQKELIDIAAILEAWVDFPEEGLAFSPFDEIITTLQGIESRIQTLLQTYEEGKVIREGLCLCLIGTPNVGKSSLMNALLKKNRAIVSDIPGTTRDTLEEELHFLGVTFRLIDTAGIRATCEVVEEEGVRRSKEALQRADITLLVLDASRKLSQEDKLLLSQINKEKSVILWNKIDLAQPTEEIRAPFIIPTSATKGIGLQALQDAIYSIIGLKIKPSENCITSLRHKDALTQALLALQSVIQGLKNSVSAEFVAADMRFCLEHLGSIIGINVTEEILSTIFSKFCIGK